MLRAAFLVVEENAEHKYETGSSSQQEKDHRQSRITKDPKRRLHPHQHCSTHYQSGYYQSECNAVSYLLKSFQNNFLIDCIDFETQFVVSGRVKDPVYASRKFFCKLL